MQLFFGDIKKAKPVQVLFVQRGLSQATGDFDVGLKAKQGE